MISPVLRAFDEPVPGGPHGTRCTCPWPPAVPAASSLGSSRFTRFTRVFVHRVIHRRVRARRREAHAFA